MIKFDKFEFMQKQSDFALLIPVINEGERIKRELMRAKTAGVCEAVDVIICDGDSTDGSLDEAFLREVGVNSLLVKKQAGKQGTQFRMGLEFVFERGYKGVITIDGNDKDSIEDVPKFVERLEIGFDFVQGSRFVKGGKAENTPFIRLLALRLIHAPLISLASGFFFTDTTNAFRGYSMRYLMHAQTQPLREIFEGYELLAYLSIRWAKLGLKACEVGVSRVYPKTGKTPTKISFFRGNWTLFKTLILAVCGKFNPR